MSQFTLFAMDESQRLVLTEFINAPDVECARRIADRRLTSFPMVELWQASMCVFRKTSPSAPSERLVP